jgi:uncharacterized membrane protein
MHPIKPTLKTEIAPVIIVAISLILSVIFFLKFPERVPTHWNFAGEVDNYSSRATAAFGIPALLVIMHFMFLFLPAIDPKRERYEQFSSVYHIFRAVIMAMLLLIYMAVGLTGLGYKVPISVITPILVGALFIILGNYFGKLKMNWFVGIKNPWTLSSESVWNKTHRMGGKLFILGGLILMLEPLMPLSWRLPVFIIFLLLIIFATFIYSYLLYRKEQSIK